jgi:hypothetical protein
VVANLRGVLLVERASERETAYRTACTSESLVLRSSDEGK